MSSELLQVAFAPHGRRRSAQPEKSVGEVGGVGAVERRGFPAQHVPVDGRPCHRLDAIGPLERVVSLPTDAPGPRLR